MTAPLATLISNVQALLLDDGTIFSTPTCTAAVREALKNFNLRAPVHAADLITVVANQKEYELTAQDARALAILDILQQAATGEDDIPLDYDEYMEDERLFFRLRAALSTGTLIARYTIPHTVSGLDSQTESTLSTLYDQVLITGAAAEACFIRSRKKVETINLSANQTINYKQLGLDLRARFEQDLIAIANGRRPAVGMPDTRAWQDDYHNFLK